ncbi:MAG: hypothetical protein ACXWDM_00335 [Nocardioides sp.]
MIVVVTGMVLFASPASAHHPQIDGTAVCNPATGQYDVTWTIRSDADHEKDWVLTSISRSIGIATPTAAADDQVAHTGHESVDPGAGTLVLEVEARWQDKHDSTSGVVTQAQSGSVTISPTRCDPDVNDASASVTTTPATCEYGETLEYGAASFATLSGTPDGTVGGPTPYSVTATAAAGHTFADGSRAQEFTGTLGGPTDFDDDQCADGDAAAAVATTQPGCGSGEQLVLGDPLNATWGVPTLTEGPGDYVVVVTADPGHRFSDGTRTQEFTGTLAGPLPDDNGPDVPGCDQTDQPEDLVREVAGAQASCELQGTMTWVDVYTTPTVWNPVPGTWALGDEVGPVRTDEEYEPYSDGEFADECVEEPEVQGDQTRVLLAERSVAELRVVQDAVPTAVDAGLVPERTLVVDDGRNPPWLALGAFLGLLGTVGVSRRRAANP